MFDFDDERGNGDYTGSRIEDRGSRIEDCGLRIEDCGLMEILNYVLRTLRFQIAD